MALQLNGDQNRVINEYYFQPFNPKGVAFTNTIYNKESFDGDEIVNNLNYLNTYSYYQQVCSLHQRN